MPGFADLPQQIQDLRPAVASAVTGVIIGTTMPISGAGRVDEVAGASLVLCHAYSPSTPDEILREAAIRVTAWLIGTRANARSERKVDPSGAGLGNPVSESDGNAERATQLRGAVAVVAVQGPAWRGNLMWPWKAP